MALNGSDIEGLSMTDASESGGGPPQSKTLRAVVCAAASARFWSAAALRRFRTRTITHSFWFLFICARCLFIRDMRIAISGSSSTGKTTLVKALSKQGVLQRFGLEAIWTDERALLRAMGFKDTAAMKEEELRTFQTRFVQQKIENEQGRDNFITEHSYVDCAAYWVVRDRIQTPASVQEDDLTARCRQFASLYAIHILLPFGAVPFQPDGYRSTDVHLHRRIANQITQFLASWQLPHVVLQEPNLKGRVQAVADVLGQIKQSAQDRGSGNWPGSSTISTRPDGVSGRRD